MSRFRAFAGAAVMVAAVIGVPATAHADDADHGDRVRCSEQALKDAIKKANDAGGGTLSLARRCTYTITTPDNEGNALPVITSKITIYGNGSTIRRSSTTAFRIFQVGALDEIGFPRQGDLSLHDVTIRNGRSVSSSTDNPGNGGGISVFGSKLTLDGCKVVGNRTDGFGGGINHYSLFSKQEDSSLTIRNSVIRGNHAHDGGGVWHVDGIATYSHSTISGNSADGQGGGLVVGGPSVVVNDTKITRNRAGVVAGGLLITVAENEGAFTSVDLNDTTVSDNTAAVSAGGIYQTGRSAARLNRSRVHGNTTTGTNGVAGGIFVEPFNLMTLRDSSVENNSSQRAPGGIFNGGDDRVDTVILISSRVVHNRPTNCSPTPLPGCVN
ncbi:hypothetical protein ACFYXH_22610 [Streptomyces sp. NPDC002730]|uniref:hypothetical protein n=1 Tax=Streptomyces sp. NPDC002730 TaxID=3364662 RepID=UPI0036785D39